MADRQPKPVNYQSLADNRQLDGDPYLQGGEDSPFPGWAFCDKYAGEVTGSQPEADLVVSPDLIDIDSSNFKSARRRLWPRPSSEFDHHSAANIYKQVLRYGTTNEKGAKIE